MATLVSPGLSITVSDESQYVPAGTGTVPLVIFATAQDKLNPSGDVASGTTKINANTLNAYGSQRELINAFGYPDFKKSAGTAVHGDELNEYGLQTAYSVLGLGNSVYALRADINLDQLVGTSVRPKGAVPDSTIWLDLSGSKFGIFEWDQSTRTFTGKTPILVTATEDTTLSSGVRRPISSIGLIGDYAIVLKDANNPVFYKNAANTWVAVGTDDWATAWPTVQSSIATLPVVTSNIQIRINTTQVTMSSITSAADVVTRINAAAIDGVTAALVAGRLVLYATSLAESDGTNADGRIVLAEGDDPGLEELGLDAGSYSIPALHFGGYTAAPAWNSTDATPRPTGSIWVKTSVLGAGANWTFKTYSATTDEFADTAAPLYADRASAIYALDVGGGGFAIAKNTLFIDYGTLNPAQYPASFKVYKRVRDGVTKIIGSTPGTFTVSEAFTIKVTQPGTASMTTYTVTLDATTVNGFVAKVLSQGIPNFSCQVESSGNISFTHRTGGEIELAEVGGGGALADAGFTSATSGIIVDPVTSNLVASNWGVASYTYSTSEPYAEPADGTYWYYSDMLDVDIMIADTAGWRGYRNVSADARGYNLTNTDPTGPIITASKPTTQVSGDPLVGGDLWIDSGDLENFPVIYRYTGTTWVKISNTDRTSQNGIVFADARWDTDGTTDPISGDLPTIAELLVSNYKDLDAPSYQLYPRGTLLFNTRRSGGNVKQYVGAKFTDDNYPNDSLPTEPSTWVNASGNADDGTPYMGHKAQRAMVVAALRAAISSNTRIRESQFSFNLIACPGYPELLSSMKQLNVDRSETAFVVGDTPIDLAANSTSIIDWSNNVATTADVNTALYYPACLTNALDGTEIVMPASHMALRTFLYNDNVSYSWFAPAGARRGLVDNATAVGYLDRSTGLFIKNGVNNALRDTLYLNRINPITNLPGVGLAVFGQKTRSPIPQATDRVNVSRLVNYIRTILTGISNSFLFEPNDKITRDQIKAIIDGAMNDLVAKRGVYDYLVVCDDSNNTPARIARNELYVDIAIEPMKDVEFIYIPIRLKNPGAIAGGGK